ncbi:hypothetical protein KY284_035986 [Solanum tuberosum]|nr:hypothetical protein KY284_035986 [Solanum tuberosum]
MNKSFDFLSAIEACGLMDLGYSGHHFTWCNQRATEARVWKRLDRAMTKDKWLEHMAQTTITHLPAVGSNHSPLLMENVGREGQQTKYFKFLHCWVENENFMHTVKECWEREVQGNPMWKLHQKMKRLASTLSEWSRREFGDIFAVVKEFEEQVRQAEEQGDENIAKAACVYFQETFTGHENRNAENILQCITRMVTEEQNQNLKALPTKEESKQVVYSMNPNSAPGPDGFGGMFYQACWDIIQDELLEAVLAYFSGHIMPKFMSHSCLVVLPKVEHPNRFNEFRPISLTNFTSKIISKILCLRLAPILPHLISENQSGFVRGRSITDNIMLAQEIIHNIKKPKEGDNVVIKLDMAKAYDSVSWSFTCLVLSAMGFGEVFIDLVWRTMSNNWYSVIVNGTRHGFFHSTRGLKQGDPLSPALFILRVEVLSRMLNLLHHDPNYKGFQMEIRGPQINHLCFADYVIIFTSGTRTSLQLIMKTLGTYEAVSDQLINKSKSHFMIPANTPQDIISIIQEITGFSQKTSPISYLGCPLYIGG